ncbi:MAG: UDP-N-acetylmuramoyl-L-alanine--D-glutamate ligase [Candidatus Solibacter usitatus]|nr:UDP-N-acetylmuramoyl-L-alanine--D-glutamate ligase [Candidatus Solibacter usitatus]
MRLEGANVLVVGLARSGLACIELLTGKGARVTGTDSRALEELPDAPAVLAKFSVPFKKQTPTVFHGRDLIVISPGVPFDLPELTMERGRGVRVVGEVELASYFLQGPVIGITGSNGKTTTTALIGHILQSCDIASQVGGNIGIPVASLIASSASNLWNVLELSSFQLENMENLRARVAVCLNITPDHLDRHKTMDSYAAAKRRLLENQRKGDWAVLNADDPSVAEFARGIESEVTWFSLQGSPIDHGFWLEGGQIHSGDGNLMPVAEIPLLGMHNVDNVRAAAAASSLAGAPLEGIRAAVRSFPGVEHRIEFVREVSGVRYYNDSKATNVDAALKSLDAFAGGLWVILGGKDKDSDYSQLAAKLNEKARGVLLIGAAAKKIESQVASALSGGPGIYSCVTLDAAVREASGRAKPGETVLLAPACASFDQFRNYEERGVVFKTLVAALPGRRGQ